MADIYYTGAAQPVAQVSDGKIGTYDAATTYKAVINGKYVSSLAAGDATAAALALITDWNESNYPEMAEITAANSGVSITLTHDTEGVDFTASLTATSGTGTVTDFSTTISASGPNHFNAANNYSGSASPSNGDSVTFSGDIPSVTQGLSATSLTTLSIYIRNVPNDWQLGLPPTNRSGFGEYPEYREQQLTIKGATLIHVDAPNCGLMRISTGAVSMTLNCYATGQPRDETIPALTVDGAHSSNLYNVLGGSVGLAVRPGETITAANIKASNQSAVTIGRGSTITAATVTSGSQLQCESSITTLLVDGGLATIRGTAAFTTLTVTDGGKLLYASSGTIGTLNAGSKGRIEFSEDIARTVTTCNAYAGSSILDSAATVTWTNGIVLTQCDVGDVTPFAVGNNRTLKVS
jgi:hypothetical protein